MKKLLLLLLFPLQTFASCNNLYPNNQKINVSDTIELCNSFYVSVYNEKKNAVIFTSEYIDFSKSKLAVTRAFIFQVDNRLQFPVLPKAYKNSGYDKGHLVPADDASNSLEMKDTFFLTNATPQASTLNRGSWKALENKVRTLATKEAIWVLTIPVYIHPEYMKNVPIPTGYWKVVYTSSGIRYFFADNKNSAKVVEYSTININLVLVSQSW